MSDTRRPPPTLESKICEEKARLERSYRNAEEAFDAARTAILQKVGRSSKDEYFTLARSADLSPVSPTACRVGAYYTHPRTRMRNHPGSTPEPQTDLVKQLLGCYRNMACKTCDKLVAAYKLEVRLFGNAVSKISGTLGDDSRLATQEAAHLLAKCRDANEALLAHLRQEHSNRNEDSDSGARNS